MKTIKVAVSKNALVPDGLVYKVLTVKNCTFPVPGSTIEKSDVDRYCQSPHWDVTVVGAMN